MLIINNYIIFVITLFELMKFMSIAILKIILFSNNQNFNIIFK